MLLQVQICKIKGVRLWYKLDATTKNFLPDTKIFPGTILKLPLKDSWSFGLVDEAVLTAATTEKKFAIKAALEILPPHKDQSFWKFCQRVARLYLAEPIIIWKTYLDLLKKLHEKKPGKVNSVDTSEQLNCMQNSLALDFSPTQEQRTAIEQVSTHLGQSQFKPFLLHGVTGSGKTLVYKYLVLSAAQRGLNTILLLPEVSLCEQFYQQFKVLEKTNNLKVLRYHSAMDAAGTKDLQHLLQQNTTPILLLGVHLPILLPLQNLGLIIIDEEHESGFSRQNWPEIDSKQMALLRAKIYGIPIVLGSATPSISTLFLAQTPPWEQIKLTQKFAPSQRTLELVPLLPKTGRKEFWLSKQLIEEITLRLARREQSIIFLNRRGYSLYAQCNQCGQVVSCNHCSVSMTIHHQQQEKLLLCHYCDAKISCPKICPSCKREDNFLFKGIGTQRLVQILQKHFPQATIVRLDCDSAKEKRNWPETTKLIEQGKIDILVGTQAITKGYNFPNVTLVGVLWADLDFNFPAYNSHEHGIQRLLQVIGRSARGQKHGKIILQFLRSLPLFEQLDEKFYPNFCTQELAMRKLADFPPCRKFYQIRLNHRNASTVEQAAQTVASRLEQANDQHNLGLEIVGPFKPGVDKIAGQSFQEIIIKGSNFDHICALLEHVDFEDLKNCQISCKPMF